MAITFGGLASGLDTDALVQAILSVEREPVNQLRSREALFNKQKSALNELNGKLTSFESALRGLSSPSNFRARTVSLSQEGVIRATAGSFAESGVFEIEVTQLARASKVVAEGVADPDQALVSDGQIYLQSGSNDAIVIDVSAAEGNNTLSQLRDTINAADAGIQASVIFDGQNYRLSVRSTESGLDNALTVADETNLDLDVAGNFVSVAQDAIIEVDGLQVTSSDNTISNVIPGVTLDLLSTNVGQTVNVEVAQDDERIIENVQSLVDSYNEVIGFINSQISPDNPGPLANDPTLRRVQAQVQSLITAGLDGIPAGGIRSLASVGVSFDGKTGETALDSDKLRDLLETNFEEVGNLFLAAGSATDPRIQFISAAGDTVPGTYDVTITQAAEKASISGSTPITTLRRDELLTIGDGTNSIDVQLLADQDTDDIVAAINAALEGSAIEATASNNNGTLVITSSGYGSEQTITAVSDRNGGNRTTGIGRTGKSDTGEDVAGQIGGVDAVGVGQTLTAAEGGDYSGLILRVTATSATVAANGGDFGTISYSEGVVPRIIDRIDKFTRFGDGDVERAIGFVDQQLDQLADDIANKEDRLASRETQLLRAFSAAERAIAALQTQQGILG